MLSNGDVVATVAVSDMAKGKEFYGEALGLEQLMENMGGVGYKVGDGQLFVYVSPTAGTGEATAAFFRVDDVREVVAELAAKGIEFEHYDMPGSTLEGDVDVMEGTEMAVAWFKDPDGNILGVGNA
ncbi:MAG: VOC family protein [Thermoleophilaceae bacterium]|nr:VOC family protein [Thermoleophilaceae bacterium]